MIVGIKRDTDPDGKPLKAGDAKEFDTKGMKTEQFQDIILGQPGVPITLVMERDGEKKEYILKRAEVGSDVIFLRSRPGLDLSEYGPWVIPRKLPAPRAFVKTPRGAANMAIEMFDYDDSDSIAWRFQ